MEDLKQKENIIILIKQSKYDRHWQHPIKITENITENWKKVGDISLYDIYIK